MTGSGGGGAGDGGTRRSSDSAAVRHKERSDFNRAFLRNRMVSLLPSASHRLGATTGHLAKVTQSVRVVVLGSRVNALLLGAAVLPWVGEEDDGVAFCCALLCLVPLAERMGYLTEQLCRHTSDAAAGLINATLGNATEVLVSLYGLQGGLYRVVQLALLGSILSNLLLVLGLSCFVGGLRWKRQTFKVVSGAVPSSLLLLSVMSLVLPAALKMSGQEDDREDELNFSRFVAVVLIMMYVAFLIFQLRTHAEEYEDPRSDDEACRSGNGGGSGESPSPPPLPAAAAARFQHTGLRSQSTPLCARGAGGVAAAAADLEGGSVDDGASGGGAAMVGGGGVRGSPLSQVSQHSGAHAHGHAQLQATSSAEAEGPGGVVDSGVAVDVPLSPTPAGGGGAVGGSNGAYALGKWESVLWLCLNTYMVSYVGEKLVGSIDGFTKQFKINSVFASAVIIPVMGNAAEHSAAVFFAYKNRMDVSMGITLGSATQIALCVTPIAVLSGWAMGRPLSLFFHGFETAALMASALIVTSILHSGTTNWLVGFLLLCSYLIVAFGFWVHELENLSASKGLPEGGGKMNRLHGYRHTFAPL